MNEKIIFPIEPEKAAQLIGKSSRAVRQRCLKWRIRKAGGMYLIDKKTLEKLRQDIGDHPGPRTT